MGIHKLYEVLKANAPKSISHPGIEKYRGKKLAVDASMVIYQTLVAIRYGKETLLNQAGETTAHLQGILYKAVNLIERGCTPVFVFDGAPPALKENTLGKRRQRKALAEQALAEAKTEEEETRHAKRTVKASKYHAETAQVLLECLGVPWVTAPGEAEAFCAQLNQAGRVAGVVSEDMDSLAFGGQVLLRNFLPALMKKGPITEIRLEAALKELRLDLAEFVDLCILLGCDYCESPKGVGPKKAVELIKQHRTIEALIEGGKISPPEDWAYQEARRLFAEPESAAGPAFSLAAPDAERLVEFLVEQNGFDRAKVANVIARLDKVKSSLKQGSLASFFQK